MAVILLFPQALVKKSKTFCYYQILFSSYFSLPALPDSGFKLVTNVTVQQCFIKIFYYYFKTRKNVNPYSASLALLFSLARKKPSGLESAATIRTKVFVWGLNDKDQLGGLKGSKVPFLLMNQ